ncbi:MAG: ATPase, T2SS/T4P/T4SS family, partial [Acidimicrobiales bacterium]
MSVARFDLQRSTGKKLGDVLLSEGIVKPRDLLRALAAQFELEFVDLAERKIDLDLAQQIPPQLARHHALPVWHRDGKIVVAMANPVDVLALDDIRDALRRPVLPVMADSEQIMAAIARLGLSDSRVQEAIQAAVGDSEPAPEEVVVTEVNEERAPIVAFVDLLLSKAVQERASDIHIEPGKNDLRVRFRVDGVLHEAMTPPRSLQAGIISRVKVMAEIDIAERRIAQDGRMSTVVGGQPVDIRVATIPTIYGEAAVLRILRSGNEAISIDNMGFLPMQLARFKAAYERPWGAILVTGPTGSGKSTTLYGALEAL